MQDPSSQPLPLAQKARFWTTQPPIGLHGGDRRSPSLVPTGPRQSHTVVQEIADQPVRSAAAADPLRIASSHLAHTSSPPIALNPEFQEERASWRPSQHHARGQASIGHAPDAPLPMDPVSTNLIVPPPTLSSQLTKLAQADSTSQPLQIMRHIAGDQGGGSAQYPGGTRGTILPALVDQPGDLGGTNAEGHRVGGQIGTENTRPSGILECEAARQATPHPSISASLDVSSGHAPPNGLKSDL